MIADPIPQALRLPSPLTPESRARWVGALVAEATQPAYGRLGREADFVAALRPLFREWAQGKEWGAYTDDEVVGVVEDWVDVRARGALAVGVENDARLREAFHVEDRRTWMALKWNVLLALAPARFTVLALRLDALHPLALGEILRRLEHHPGGAWAVLKAMSTPDRTGAPLTRTTPLGRELTGLILPGQPARTEVAEISRRADVALRKMAWGYSPPRDRKRIADEAAPPDARGRRDQPARFQALVNHFDAAVWEAVRGRCTGSPPAQDLLRRAMGGGLDIIPTTIANRVTDWARKLTSAAERRSTEERASVEVALQLRAEGARLTVRPDGDEADLLRAARELLGDPVWREPLQVFLARGVTDDDWSVLEARHGYSRRTLKRWYDRARQELRRRLGGGPGAPRRIIVSPFLAAPVPPRKNRPAPPVSTPSLRLCSAKEGGPTDDRTATSPGRRRGGARGDGRPHHRSRPGAQPRRAPRPPASDT
ncbi:MAG: sigma-70 family RNA polymerase sigma factor [Elusimicrobia bacterium]|nr:sigma-70 family RNA polymerase sigma factor [Elusimicrobiota bacterium]